MSKQSSKSNKKQKRDEISESESDDDLQPIHFFVPGENINAAVLVEYVTQYVDRTAKITSSHHPTDKTRTGFNVLAKKTLNAVSLRDVINDSRDWDLETQSKKFRKDPYRYAESDTARRRARQGASKGGTNRPARSAREPSAEPESYRREKASNPSHQYSGAQPQAGSGYQQGPSRPDYASNTYNTNIYNAVNTTSYANIPANPSQHPLNAYSYSQIPKPISDYPPPSYEQAAPRGPPRPQTPIQPDPDSFDREKGPSRTQSGEIPTSRQASTSHEDSRRRQEAHDEMTRRASRR